MAYHSSREVFVSGENKRGIRSDLGKNIFTLQPGDDRQKLEKVLNSPCWQTVCYYLNTPVRMYLRTNCDEVGLIFKNA